MFELKFEHRDGAPKNCKAEWAMIHAMVTGDFVRFVYKDAFTAEQKRRTINAKMHEEGRNVRTFLKENRVGVLVLDGF